jgi:hypothetical protein
MVDATMVEMHKSSNIKIGNVNLQQETPRNIVWLPRVYYQPCTVEQQQSTTLQHRKLT